MNRLAFTTLTAIVAASALQGCASASEKLEKRLKVGEPVGRVYNAKYEEVEAAIKQAMIKYPQRVDNTEDGIFETDFVKGEARFRPPQMTEAFSPGYRYRILIRLVKGKATAAVQAVKVLVTKQIEIARDFFAEPQPVASDGLEENVVLYRIGREITLARALVKANEKANQAKEASGL